MTNHDKLLRDICTLRESIQMNFQEMACRSMPAEERNGIIKNSQCLLDELKILVDKLNQAG